MSLTLNQKVNSINNLRKHVSAFLTAVNDFGAFSSLYTALDLGNALADLDFTGDNAGITKADWVAAVGIMQTVATITGPQRTTLSKVANI